MKVKISILLMMAMTIISGCNLASSESNIPEDFSKKYYQMFVDSYELYEERVQENNGQFVDANGEPIEFGAEIFTDPDMMEKIWEDTKKKLDGKKGLFTETERLLIHDFVSLYFAKQAGSWDESFKEAVYATEPEYADPIQVAIDLEQNIINTLELEKEPITAIFQSE